MLKRATVGMLSILLGLAFLLGLLLLLYLAVQPAVVNLAAAVSGLSFILYLAYKIGRWLLSLLDVWLDKSG